MESRTAFVRRIAVAAEVDDRTVLRVLHGKPVRPASAARIARALAKLSQPAAEPAAATETER